MLSFKQFILILIIVCLQVNVYSQNIFQLNTDTIKSDDLLFQFEDDTLLQTKKKKKKKNVYFGEKTKKGFIKSTSGRNNLYENFNYIKTYSLKDPYAQGVYIYDKKKKKIFKTRKKIDESFMLHGPYTKRINDQIIEDGFFYFGLKHGRWVRLNNSDILQDKETYFLGWLNESIRFFWGPKKEHIKEIIPIKYGERNGMYYAFHLNGSLAAKGEYLHNKKIGVWTEYFSTNEKKKREIKFNKVPFDIENAFITREWNLNGKLIYDRSFFLKKIN